MWQAVDKIVTRRHCQRFSVVRLESKEISMRDHGRRRVLDIAEHVQRFHAGGGSTGLTRSVLTCCVWLEGSVRSRFVPVVAIMRSTAMGLGDRTEVG